MCQCVRAHVRMRAGSSVTLPSHCVNVFAFCLKFTSNCLERPLAVLPIVRPLWETERCQEKGFHHRTNLKSYCATQEGMRLLSAGLACCLYSSSACPHRHGSHALKQNSRMPMQASQATAQWAILLRLRAWLTTTVSQTITVLLPCSTTRQF